MKVVFLETLPGVATIWEIKDVKPWHLRNYLLPNGIAVPASDEIIEETKQIREDQERIKKEKIEAAIAKQDDIAWHVIDFVVKADWVNLYAAITEKDIIDRINSSFQIDLDKKVIKNTKIKTTWEHPVNLHLADWVTVWIIVKVAWEWEDEEKGKKKWKKAEKPKDNEKWPEPEKKTNTDEVKIKEKEEEIEKSIDEVV